MTDQKDNSNKSLWLLGAAITLPMILVSGPIAGFLIGQFVLVKLWNFPRFVVLICVFLGFIGSGIQSYQLIQKIKDLDSKNKT